ncbi:MAG: TIM barrel protein [Clostridia bacterium]
MKKLHLAAQLYTLRDFTRDIRGFRDTLRRLKAMGYDSFQYSGAGPLDPHEVLDAMQEHNMPMSATHTAPALLQNELDAVIQNHQLWNCEFVGIGMMPEEYRKTREGIVAFAREFSGIGRSLRDNGLTLIYHNHSFEYQKFGRDLIMDILLEESDPAAFDIELDTYWVQAGGADPIQWIRKVDKRMRYIHFKDMAVSEGRQVFAPVGEGNLNWEGIIRACMETDVEACAVEQDVCEGSPFDCLSSSIVNLRQRYGL